MKFERYKRGQVILVNFSPSLGSEIKNKHLAIVLNKKDSPNNSVLTVIPLTSKCKPYYLCLGDILYAKVSPYINEIDDSSGKLSADNLKEFQSVVKTYTKMNKITYAMVSNISTVSKMRIQKPLNKYDPIKKIKVESETMDKIDGEIIKLFTK